jgi:hypothetical protein
MSETPLPYSQVHPIRFWLYAFLYGLLWPFSLLDLIRRYRQSMMVFTYIFAIVSCGIMILLLHSWWSFAAIYGVMVVMIWHTIYTGRRDDGIYDEGR